MGQSNSRVLGSAGEERWEGEVALWQGQKEKKVLNTLAKRSLVLLALAPPLHTPTSTPLCESHSRTRHLTDLMAPIPFLPPCRFALPRPIPMQ